MPGRTLPFRPRQPLPISTVVSFYRGITAIARRFRRDEVAHCRLCPRCTAGPDGCCLVQIDGAVDERDAPLFRLAAPPSRDVGGATG